MMQPVVLALASNERYFPGLYCAVASALSYRNTLREVNLKVLDGGISGPSRDTLLRLIERIGEPARLEFVTVEPSVFGKATPGPGQSHVTYYRTLLPQLLDVPRLIYLDCDVLVFRDLSELFDLELPTGKVLAAVRDSETLLLADDSPTIADAMSLPSEGAYFNCGVMLMNLDQLRKEGFPEQCLDFLRDWSGRYQFHDQSAINFLLYDRIAELSEYWNRASWRFDEQDNNDLNCILHYTRSAPWLGATRGPAQVLFERFAAEVGLSPNGKSAAFKKSRRQQFIRDALAPFRALAFPLVSLSYRIAGAKDKSAGYQKAARYWSRYILNSRRRRRRHRKRINQIQSMKFKFAAVASLA